MTITKGLKQAYDVQDLAYDALMAMRNQLSSELGKVDRVSREDASAISALIGAWQRAQEQVRVHRGKPLPGSLTPAEREGKMRKRLRGLASGSLLAGLAEDELAEQAAVPASHD